MKDFVSPDGSFGFGGFNDQTMTEMMVPALKEFVAEATNEEFFTGLIAKIAAVNPEFDALDVEIMGNNVLCVIMATKKYGLDEHTAIQMAAKQEIIQWCFTKYIGEKGGNLDALFPAETVVNIGGGRQSVSISASEASDEMKAITMMPIVAETSETVVKDEKLRYSAQKMLNKLKPYSDKIDYMKEPMFASVLMVRYKRSFDEAFELAKNGKALQTCFEEYLKETGTSIMSDAMGQPPSSSAH